MPRENRNRTPWSDRKSYKEHVIKTADGEEFKLYDPGRNQHESYSKSMKNNRKIYAKVKEYAKENGDKVDGDGMPLVHHEIWYKYLSRAAYETGEGWGVNEKLWITSPRMGERGFSMYLGLSPVDTIRKSKKRQVAAAGAGDDDEQEARKVAAPKVPSDEMVLNEEKEEEEKPAQKVSAEKSKMSARECTIKGVKYACNTETGKIYDLESFMEYIRGEREEPFLVGQDFDKDGKKMIRIDVNKLEEIKKQHEEKKKRLEEEKERKEQEEHESFVNSLTPVTYKGKNIFYGPFDERSHSYPLYSESEDDYHLIGDYEPDSIFTKKFDENKLDNFVIQYRGYDTDTSEEEEYDHAAQVQAEIEEEERWQREMEESEKKWEDEREEREKKQAEDKKIAKQKEEEEANRKTSKRQTLKERMKARAMLSAASRPPSVRDIKTVRPPAAGDDEKVKADEPIPDSECKACLLMIRDGDEKDTPSCGHQMHHSCLVQKCENNNYTDVKCPECDKDITEMCDKILKDKTRTETATLPEGWKAAWSNTHKRFYYFKKGTNETKWKKPTQSGGKKHKKTKRKHKKHHKRTKRRRR